MTGPDHLLAPPAPPDLRPGPPPSLSVLLPAYDAATTIGEAVESVLTQVPAPYEVVVSDDGSRDDLVGALHPFGQRVRLVRGPNAGVGTARNRAAGVATGELLALLDADDVWLPGRAAALMAAAAARPDLTVITTDAVVVRDGVPEATSYYATRQFPVVDQEAAVLVSNFVLGTGAIRAGAFRAVGGYCPGSRAAEDWDLWLRLLLTGHRAGLVRRPLYEYRRSAGSLTGQRLPLALGTLAVLQQSRRLVRTPGQRRQLQRTEQLWREKAARAAGALGDPRARSLALRAAGGRWATPRARLGMTARTLLPAWVPAHGRTGS